MTLSFIFFIFCLRALKEQQSRTLVEATQPGRRGNCPNMRQGETAARSLQTTGHKDTEAGESAVFALHQAAKSFSFAQVGWCLGKVCALDFMCRCRMLISIFRDVNSFVHHVREFQSPLQFHATSLFVCLFVYTYTSQPPPLSNVCFCILFLYYSEIRLMEIVEGLCESSSFECNHMLEEHEEHFETWWFKRWVVVVSDSRVQAALASCFLIYVSVLFLDALQENKTSRFAQMVLCWNHQSVLSKGNIWAGLQW